MTWLANHRMAVLGFAVTAAYFPGLLSPAYTPRWAILLIGLPLAAALDPRTIPLTLRWIVAWVLAMATVATAWASPDPLSGWLELFYIAILCLAALAGAGLSSMTDVMRGIGVGLAVSSLLAVSQYVGLWSPVPQSSSPAGLFYNSEVLAELAALVLVWSITTTANRAWIIGLFALVPLVLCGSRVAVIAAACGLIYAWWPRNPITRAAVIAVGLTALGIMVFGVGLHKMASADHRLILWGSTIMAWTQWGHGLGWFEASHPFEGMAHSDALQVIAEVGIAGFALLAIPIIAFRRNRGTHAERACFVAVCVEVFISFPLHFPASGFLAACLAGYLVSDWAPVRDNRDHGGYDDGRIARWQDAPGAGDFGHGGSRGCPLPVRSGATKSTAFLSRQDRADTAEPRGT